MTKAMLISLIAAAVVADQLTKAAALSLLSQGTAVPVLPGFNLTLGFNDRRELWHDGRVHGGQAPSDGGADGRADLAFAVMAFRAQHALERAGFALVVGGALGNIIDRLRQGAVTDFLDFYWRDWHWPTFNVADIAITLGRGPDPCRLASPSSPQGAGS
jgi:signal peptidase II